MTLYKICFWNVICILRFKYPWNNRYRYVATEIYIFKLIIIKTNSHYIPTLPKNVTENLDFQYLYYLSYNKVILASRAHIIYKSQYNNFSALVQNTKIRFLIKCLTFQWIFRFVLLLKYSINILLLLGKYLYFYLSIKRTFY